MAPARAVGAPRHAPSTLDAFSIAARALGNAATSNAVRLDALCAAKDESFDDIKRALASAQAAVVRRDADLHSQRFVLKYLVETTTALREALRRGAGGGGGQRAVSSSFLMHTPKHRVGEGGGVVDASFNTTNNDYDDGDDGNGDDDDVINDHYNDHVPLLNASLVSPLPPQSEEMALTSPPRSSGSGKGGGEFGAYSARAANAAASAAAAGGGVISSTSSTDVDSIEAIVGHKVLVSTNNDGTNGQKLLYRVRWKGAKSDGTEDEWFTREDLVTDFPGVVATFEAGLRTRLPLLL